MEDEITLREAIAKMGGPDILAQLMDVKVDTVYKWQARGKVGSKNVLAFIDLAKRFGVKISFKAVLEGVESDE